MRVPRRVRSPCGPLGVAAPRSRVRVFVDLSRLHRDAPLSCLAPTQQPRSELTVRWRLQVEVIEG